MLSLALRELMRRWTRALLCIAGFLLVALLISAGMCLGDAVERATAESMAVTGADLVVIRSVTPCAFALVKRPKDLGAIQQIELERIRQLPGIVRASGSLVVWAFHGNQPTVVTGVVPDSVKKGILKGFKDGERCCVLEAGRFFDPTKYEAVLDKGYADTLGVEVGDTVPLGPHEFEVVGILKVAGIAVIGGGQAYVPLPIVQEMLGEGDIIDFIYINATEDADIEALTAGIEEIMGAGCQVSSQENLPEQIGRSAALSAAGSGAFVVLILGVGGLLMVRSSLASVRERVTEIGILRAIGWRRRHVATLLGAETFLQGVLGALPGTAIGYALAFATCARMSLALPGSFNSYPACATTAPALDLTLQPQVTATGVLVTLGLTIALALTAGLLAGCYAANRPPMESLRQP